MDNYKNSKIWRQSLAPADAAIPHASARALLSAVYDSFWENTARLAQNIAQEFPGLTLHDERHLNALWERAGQLLDANDALNPLEAFILGGAILLHDAGHAVKAYKGGKAEIEAGIAYKDALAAQIRRERGSVFVSAHQIVSATEETKASALFNTVRRAHAKKAEELAGQQFEGAYLIENDDLRLNIGPIMGRIAASHHWSREVLVNNLRQNQGAPDSMPAEWGFNPVRLACLLRCADAIQIDQQRASAFAFALHNPQGESRLHWIAQRHISQPQVVPSDKPSALVFTSQHDFEEHEADAWWVAYDLLKLANDELQGCYRLMKDLKIDPFVVNRVQGTESVEEVASLLRTKGWQPIKAEVKVTKAERIIEMFGGSQLYGSSPKIPLRELIQNGSDSVAVRKKIAADAFFDGKVLIRLIKNGNDNYTLSVLDNGVGMSEYVLTGPLLEFGKSFWSSDEAQDDLPGLLSAGIMTAGRYGIGFFSILMVAREFQVTSRRWSEGHDQTRSLLFRDGIKLRPLVVKSSGNELGDFSTEIKLKLSVEVIDQLLSIGSEKPGSGRYTVSLYQLLGQLCSALDTDIYCQIDDEKPKLVHGSDWAESDALEFVRSVSYAEIRHNEELDRTLETASKFVSKICNETGEILGRGCVAFDLQHAGLMTIGGLASGQGLDAVLGLQEAFIGALEYEPSGPSRQHGALLDSNLIEGWASDQALAMAANGDLLPYNKYLASLSVSFFGGDPEPVSHAYVNREFIDLNAVIEDLRAGQRIVMPVNVELNQKVSLTQIAIHRLFVSFLVRTDDIVFLERTIEGRITSSHLENSYNCIISADGKIEKNSMLDCLNKKAKAIGGRVNFERFEGVEIATYIGENSSRENIEKGTAIKADCLVVTYCAL